ncbi:hypothetical protein BGZ51_004173 [Haplosporangium sp. Z 767]|nr:hypothetical protein BGZ51_004173 [Haplosporangium sp. Z 767]
MHLSHPRGGRYETLAADDDQDMVDLQSVLVSNQMHDASRPSPSSLQKRPTPQQHYADLGEDSVDEDGYSSSSSRYSFSSDNEKHYQPPTHIGNALFPDRVKLTSCNRLFLGLLAVLMVMWVGFALFLGFTRLINLTSGTMTDMRPSFQFEDMFNQSFTPKYQSLAWMPYGDDGVFSRINANGDIILTHVDGSEPRVFLPGANVTDAHGNRIPFFTFQVSPDEKFVLLGADRRKQWRHSFNATYYIYSMEDYALTPLLESVDEPGVELVVWSPVGHSLAYVQNNNLYVYQDLTHRNQITFDGAASIFNGITDWVYEEEVYGSPSALWWSPDGTSIAFLRFDETEVPEFHYSLYMDDQLNAPAYPRNVMMKYPKVGFPNPIVNLHLYNVKSAVVPTAVHPLKQVDLSHIFDAENRIIAEVIWATRDSDALLVKVQNRVQNHEKLVLVNPTTMTGEVVREWNAGKEDGGWIDMQQSSRYVGPSKAVPAGGYLDIANNNGYNHIALYTPVDNPTPKWLTSGEWEVQSINAVNELEGLVYYISTEKASVERHLYSVAMDSTTRTALTDVTQPGYYAASFSTGAGYYLLSYRGPDVPWQKVKMVADEKFSNDLEDNALLRSLLNATQHPTRRWSTVNLNGRECNYMEFLPPGFTPEQKHPVLFQVYGGPGSQLVDTQFQLGFSAVMSSVEKLKYVVVVVDGRGTGFRGRDFRISVVNQLGKLETEDQIAAGEHWKTLSYVDPDRMAIWGWSYGGFMAAKVTEANSGVFKAAMSVAPVTDFRFYDSVYTERYMNLPTTNLEGYEATAVTNMTGFNNADYLLVHGTGDDNVHVQNAFVLIDRLTLAGNHRYKSHFFTDSDHAIRSHNANHEVYWLLTENLWEKLGGFLSAGAVFLAKVTARSHLFKVMDIQFEEQSSSSNLGVIMESTIVDICQEPIRPQVESTADHTKDGEDGKSDLSKEICRFIIDSFYHENAYARLSIPNKKAVIITGVAGTGKNTIVRSCCRSVGLRMFPLSLPRALSDKEIMESDQGGALSYIKSVFDMALQSAPSAVIIQDLDILAKDRSIDSQLHSSTISILCKEMERASRGKDVFVFAISRDRSKLPDVLTRPGVFQHEFNIPIPIRAQRQSILESLRIKSDVASMAAQVSSGYVAKDLRNLCRSALLYSLREGSISEPPSETIIKRTTLDSLTWKNFSYAIDTSKPSQQIEFESIVSRRTWNDFGGYGTLKKRVHQAIQWPITNPETFKRMGVKPPMGLLLYGPSGCGKTMLIQVLASESKMNFIPIKGPEIFSKYLGETEATLRRLFAMARQIAPCILFFDEMDSIGAKRGWGGDADTGSNGINERVLSTLLNEMDGVEERTGVFIVGCTNQPRAMDDALLRPGRLDQLIYVGYPALQDRKEIIETISKRIPLPSEPAIRTSLAQRTAGFSPGDMDSLFREAAILSLRRDIESKSVQLEDIDTVLQKMSPTVQDRVDKSASLREDGEDVLVPELYRQFQQDR